MAMLAFWLCVLAGFVWQAAAQDSPQCDDDQAVLLQKKGARVIKTGAKGASEEEVRASNGYCTVDISTKDGKYCCNKDHYFDSKDEACDGAAADGTYRKLSNGCESAGGRRRSSGSKVCCNQKNDKNLCFTTTTTTTTTTTAAWGPTCKVLHHDLIKLAKDAYSDNCGDMCDDYGWHRIEDYSDNGHYAYMYQRSSDGCRVLAFRGTEFTDFDEVAADIDFYGYEDMPTDETSGNGGKDIKVYPGPKKALQNLKELPSGSDLDYVTGHSLGGSMATLYSLRKGIPREQTVTFAAMATRYDDEHCTLPNSVRYANQDDPAVGEGEGLCLIPTGIAMCAANAGGAWEHFNHDAEEVRAFFKYQENGHNLWKDCSKSDLCRDKNPSCKKKLNDASVDFGWHATDKYKAAVWNLWPDEYR
eukprot:TRINITY_DN8324_c0_g2_i2.p1 TRINITY_DN8324_c0_g2~~TRINITY_DN8324_c0_g2_i2.p1  ORF type:complete len:416 (+),score=69.04 TRINITY_DN8324_c0_g2_i2:98-1345(+)